MAVHRVVNCPDKIGRCAHLISQDTVHQLWMEIARHQSGLPSGLVWTTRRFAAVLLTVLASVIGRWLVKVGDVELRTAADVTVRVVEVVGCG